MRLSHRDVLRYQRAVLDLQSCRTLDELRLAVHTILLAAVPGDYSQVVESRIDLADRSARFVACWESDAITTPEIAERFQHVLLDHPFTRDGVLAGRPNHVGRLSDYFSRREYRNSRLFSELYRHVDVGDLMGTAMVSGQRHLAMSVSRTRRGRSFSDRDRFMFSLLRPHFALARARIDENPAAETVCRPGGDYGLTPREGEVARWVAEGKTNLEIATILHMKVRTVEKHVERLLVKLGTENRTAAALALRGSR